MVLLVSQTECKGGSSLAPEAAHKPADGRFKRSAVLDKEEHGEAPKERKHAGHGGGIAKVTKKH